MTRNRVRASVRASTRTGAAAIAALVALALVSPAQAQSRVWFVSAHYESPGFTVPVLFVTSAGDEREWSAGVAGWTVSFDWRSSLSDRVRLHVATGVTPVNAHSSNYIYRGGRRERAAEFRNASVEARGGVEIEHAPGWTGGYRLVMVYEGLDRVAPVVARFWQRPFAGVEITQRYTRVTSDELFGSRWEGVKGWVRGQVFTGRRTWSRVEADIGAGTRRGRLFLSGRAAGFAGASLDNVSAFLIGGSWDLPLPTLLAGYRYAEFRLPAAAVANGALDVTISGSWEAGARGSCVAARQVDACGAAVQVTTVRHGVVLRAGAAVPLIGRGRRQPIGFASMAVALVER